MKILKDKKFIKECLIILIVGIVINGACFFLCSITGHCANENPNEQFPYQIGIPSNVSIPSEVVNQAISSYITILSSQYGYDGSNGALCFFENSDGNRYIITCCDELTFDISGYPTTFVYRATHQHWVQFVYNADTGVLSDGNFYGGYVATWTFSAQSLATTSHGYILGSVQDDFYASYGSSTVKVWTKNGGNVSDLIGEFTDLPNIDEIINNIQNNWQPPSTTTGHALPSAPTENPNNTPFQDRLQMFEYLKDSINAIVGNLGYNIKNWFDNLIGKMVDGFNSVSQNVWNGFFTLMNNIKDFFGPKIDAILEVLAEIRDKTGYLTDDFDYEEVVDYYEENCSLFELSSSISSFHSSLSSTFSGVIAPQRLVFNIDFSNGPWPFSTVGIVSFNFDWYENIRNTIVPWILTFLYFGAVFSLGMQLPNIVHGMSGMFSPTLTGTQSISYMDTDGAYSSYNKVNTDHYSMFGGSMHFTKQHAYSSVSYKNKYGLPSVRK